MPKEHTKTVNKNFWSAFKTFFGNKNKFFKKLEGKREENLQLKEELVKKADALKESDNWDDTASKLKELQQEWKNIGPVPEKVKNDVFNRFKKACDEFFNRRREHGKEVESEYAVNLARKEEICEALEKMGKQQPDLILLDLMMPEMDGFEFLAELRALEGGGEIPVVVITAADLTEQDRVRLNGGVEQILRKTAFDRDALLDEIRREVTRILGGAGDGERE